MNNTNPQNNTQDKWENLYKGTSNDACIPYTDTLTALLRHFNKDLKGKRILEIGCGVGQNILFISWYFNAKVWGIDFSKSAIEKARYNFITKGVHFENLSVGDIAKTHFKNDYFDAIIERGVIQCNSFSHSKRIVTEAHRILKKGGLLTCSLANENHFMFGNGIRLENGSFNNPDADGLRYFFSKSNILDLFSSFTIKCWQSNNYFDCLHNRYNQASFVLDLIKK